MREAVINKKKYLQLPEEIPLLVPKSNSVQKLSIQHCYNGKVQLHAKHWENLQYLEIIDCSYLEISLYFPEPSQMELVYIGQCDSLDIGEILGYFPKLIAFRIDNSKLIKFKGQIKGEINLRSIEFHHVLRSEIFQSEVSLPKLEQIGWDKGCNFFKTDFSLLTAPNLHILSYRDSNYLNFQSLGNISPQLTSFKFENCAYPKLNIDFKELAKISSDDKKNDDFSQWKNYFQPDAFRIVKSSKIAKKKSKAKNPFRNPNSPDMQMLKNAQDPMLIKKNAKNFLNSTNKDLSSKENQQKLASKKFCPQCGTNNPLSAGFCSNCGEKFRT